MESVGVARVYVHETDGATGIDIVLALEPEENHWIGILAARVLGNLDHVEFYRKWWWDEVVEPRLRVLPGGRLRWNVARMAPGGRGRRLGGRADVVGADSTGDGGTTGDGDGFESVTDVRDVLDDDALFERAFSRGTVRQNFHSSRPATDPSRSGAPCVSGRTST